MQNHHLLVQTLTSVVVGLPNSLTEGVECERMLNNKGLLAGKDSSVIVTVRPHGHNAP
jgi:hypothetical protein